MSTLLVLLVVLCLQAIQGYNVHRVSNMKILSLDVPTDNPFAPASVVPSIFNDTRRNAIPKLGNTLNLKLNALDLEIDLDLNLVDDLLTENAYMIMTGKREFSEGEGESDNQSEGEDKDKDEEEDDNLVTRPLVNSIYSGTHTDEEGNIVNIFVSAISPTIVNGYISKNGVDYKFAPLYSMRKEIGTLASQFSNSTAYSAQLSELDEVFGPASPSDIDEMILVDLSYLPHDRLSQFNADPSTLNDIVKKRKEDLESSGDSDSTQAQCKASKGDDQNTQTEDVVEGGDSGDNNDSDDIKFETEASGVQRNPLYVNRWTNCHPHMNSKWYGIVDLSIDRSAFIFYTAFVDHPHIWKDDFTYEYFVMQYILIFMAKVNYYFKTQMEFHHKVGRVAFFRGSNPAGYFNANTGGIESQMFCQNRLEPDCAMTANSYKSTLAFIRPHGLMFKVDQPPIYYPPATLIAFTGLFASTADARASPSSYGKAAKVISSMVIIPIYAPRPYNTIAKMLAITMGATATNDPNNVCSSRGTNYLSGIMGDADGIIKSESTNNGQPGFAKTCNFSELCNYIKYTMTSPEISAGAVTNAGYTYVSKCGNFEIEEMEECEKFLDPICCSDSCLVKPNMRCASGDPTCCVNCMPKSGNTVCYDSNNRIGVCGVGGYCRPSHCQDYNLNYVPCTNPGYECEERCKLKGSADSTCITLPTRIRDGQLCDMPSSTAQGVCINKVCQTQVIQWRYDERINPVCHALGFWLKTWRCMDQGNNVYSPQECAPTKPFSPAVPCP